MKDLYYNKYLKYKVKYLQLKNMQGGAPNKRLMAESQKMLDSGKYKLVNLIKEENTVYVTLNDDRIIKIKVEDNFPFSSPMIFCENKYINPKLLDWNAPKRLDNYLEKIDNYPFIEYKEIPSFIYDETYSLTKKFTADGYVKLFTSDDYIENANEVFINISDKITNGKILLDAIENFYIKINGCLIRHLLLGNRKITEISEEDYDMLKSGIPLFVIITKIKTVDKFIYDLQNHSDISMISKLKPVATNKSGTEPRNYAQNWNLYNKTQKERILNDMSKFLTEKNGYEIKFNIKFDEKSSNVMIYYSENYLDKLSKLFEHESLDKSLELIAKFNTDNLDFIYIAFGDIDITKLQKIEDLSENGKRIYKEYMK